MSEEQEFHVGGLRVWAEPGWEEIEVESDIDCPPLLLTKERSGAIVQFSVPDSEDADEGRITMDELRYWMKDMAKKAKLGRGFDMLELSGENLVYALSFEVDLDFQRLWYWSDRKRLVLVTYGREGPADKDELIECERMVARMRFET